MRETLKPCPDAPKCDIRVVDGLIGDLSYVKCCACGATTDVLATPEHAIAAWNRRASEQGGESGGEPQPFMPEAKIDPKARVITTFEIALAGATAAGRIAELEAENAKLREREEVTRHANIDVKLHWDVLKADYDAATTAIAEANRKIERLREALAPFARADRAIGNEPGPFRFETGTGHRELHRDDLRRARAALAETEAPEKASP